MIYKQGNYEYSDEELNWYAEAIVAGDTMTPRRWLAKYGLPIYACLPPQHRHLRHEYFEVLEQKESELH